MRTQWIAIAGIVVVIIGTALFVTGALMTRLTSLSFIPRKICDVGHRNSRCQGVKYFALGSEGCESDNDEIFYYPGVEVRRLASPFIPAIAKCDFHLGWIIIVHVVPGAAT
jgi:hypothetical protein